MKSRVAVVLILALVVLLGAHGVETLGAHHTGSAFAAMNGGGGSGSGSSCDVCYYPMWWGDASCEPAFFSGYAGCRTYENALGKVRCETFGESCTGRFPFPGSIVLATLMSGWPHAVVVEAGAAVAMPSLCG